MPRRKKHPRLPNGYGSIRYLGKNRKNPYAVHPPSDIDGNRPPAICYVDEWMKGFIILTAYKAGTYIPGMESTLELPTSNTSLDTLAQKIMSDYSSIKGLEPVAPEKTFSDVYHAFFQNKFAEGHKYSPSSVRSTKAAYKNCKSLYDKKFRDLRAKDLQENLDSCPLKHSSLELIKNLYHQMYRYADSQGLCDKDYSQYVLIKSMEDDEHGVPFTDEELRILWSHSEDIIVKILLIMCYSGWRISEYKKLEINLDKHYFFGGIKTAAGKNRIVPIHPAIFPFVVQLLSEYGCLFPYKDSRFRKELPALFEKLNIHNIPNHTPHDCRHTFSRLCEKFHVSENDRKRMLGHAFSDITNSVYGHRDLEDLKTEIEKIKIVTLL